MYLYVNISFSVSLRGEVWMSISGGFAQQQKYPDLYKNLLKATSNDDVGKFT